METPTLLCINFNGTPHLELMLKSYVLNHYKDEPLKLCLIDNCSTDGSYEWLLENGVPVRRLESNIGHENAIELVYPELTGSILLVDSDVIFYNNIHHYFDRLKDGVVASGDLVTGDNIGTDIMPRLGAWGIWFDIDACKAAGITYFRNKDSCAYDVASQFYENIIQAGLKVDVQPRLPGNIDRDEEGMRFGDWAHLGKCSWEMHKHGDRFDEVEMRKSYVRRRLKEFESVDLKGKFI